MSERPLTNLKETREAADAMRRGSKQEKISFGDFAEQVTSGLAAAMIQEGIESGRITQIEIPSLDMVIRVRPSQDSE